MFKGIVVIALGAFFMIGSFYGTRVRGGLSRGRGIPASRSHKIFFFLLGLIVFIKGLTMLWR